MDLVTRDRAGSQSRLQGRESDVRIGLTGRMVGGVVIAALFMGSTLLTPLYDLYKELYRLSAVELSLLYAVYVLGNLTALLFLGRLSDQVGRKPVALAGLVLAGVSAALFLAARGPGLLFAGRVVSGLAVGIGSGSATAWITESTPEPRRARAAATMTAFNFLGLTLGPVAAGALIQYAPLPLRLPFLVYLALLALTAAATLAPKETAPRKGGLDLRPRLGVPKGARLRFVAPAAAGFTAMSVVGFYAALGPSLVRQALNLDNRALASLVVADMFLVAAVVIVLTRRVGARAAMLAGLALTPVGLGLLTAAQAFGSTLLMLGGATVCGGASALGYRGGLGSANALAPPDRRAEVASSYFVCCFLGNALPIVGVAVLSRAWGAPMADRTFAAVLTVLAVAAMACNLAFEGEKPNAA
jgi:predicted MFS family arabinose efflux permease